MDLQKPARVSSLPDPGADPAMSGPTYFMESEEESLRLDLKTDSGTVEEQARWAGVVPGIRVADLGCGAGCRRAVFAEVLGSLVTHEHVEDPGQNHQGCQRPDGDARGDGGRLGIGDTSAV